MALAVAGVCAPATGSVGVPAACVPGAPVEPCPAWVSTWNGPSSQASAFQFPLGRNPTIVSGDGRNGFAGVTVVGPSPSGPPRVSWRIVAFDPATGAQGWTSASFPRDAASSGPLTAIALVPSAREVCAVGVVYGQLPVAFLGSNQSVIACFDIGTGRLRWSTTISGNTSMLDMTAGGARLFLTGYRALPHYRAPDLRVVARTVAFTATGRQLWDREIPMRGAGSWSDRIATSADGSRIFVAGVDRWSVDERGNPLAPTDFTVTAIDGHTGAVRWRRTEGCPALSQGFAPCDWPRGVGSDVAGNRVFVSTDSGVCSELIEGVGSPADAAPPPIGDGCALVTNGYAGATGAALWSATQPGGLSWLGRPLAVSSDGNSVFYASTDVRDQVGTKTNVVWLDVQDRDAATGTQHWQTRVPLPQPSNPVALSFSPLYGAFVATSPDGASVFVATTSITPVLYTPTDPIGYGPMGGVITKFDATSGTLAWASGLGELATSSRYVTSLAVSPVDGRVVVGEATAAQWSGPYSFDLTSYPP